jgi:type I restriction enzyme M protein
MAISEHERGVPLSQILALHYFAESLASPTEMPTHHDHANLIWQIADLLRGPYRPPQYERVMLPMTVLRRFDCVLAPTKAKVLAEYDKRKGGKLTDDALDQFMNKAAGQRFHNHSPLDFQKLKGDPDNLQTHLRRYIRSFSANVRTIFEFFEFENEIERMHEANILYLVVSKFSDVDLHPSVVRNEEMGLIFENLIRRFNELANETAGDHFTPREVIRLMVNLLFINDDDLLATPGTVRKMLDPACGTGGMLAEAQSYLREHHSAAKLYAYGQDYNKRAFATAASDMLMKEVAHNGGGDNVRYGDIFTADQFPRESFDYLIANPPFGVDWKKQQREIQQEQRSLGFAGRFGAGLPRVNDGSLLFLQHMVSKFEPVLPDQHKHGSRLALVFSGSPLFTGGAGSGESEIRRWIIENDWLEAVVALPEQMFYNTGIGTYIWIVTNRKEKRRNGKIQLVDAREMFQPGGAEDNRRSLGDKRRHISASQIDAIVKIYGRFKEGDTSKTFDNADFGYTRVTVERPLRLRYQMTLEDKARFLDACPLLLDDVQAIDKDLGREPQLDWNALCENIYDLLRKRQSKWKATEQKLFRDVFTIRDSQAERVITAREIMYGEIGKGPRPGQTVGGVVAPDPLFRNRGLFPDPTGKTKKVFRYEPDAELRDFENIPLKEDIDAYFNREVLPHVADAWMDRTKDKIGYEINFNRHFYKFTPPRELAEIDAEIEQAEKEFLRLFKEVTKE